MSLLEQQNLLARLYTDENLRRAFLSAPDKIGKENRLSASEIAEIVQIIPVEIEFFAGSLFWKRLREVEKILPLTREVLGKEFSKLFREFSQNFNPQSIKKHSEDAVEFCASLKNSDSISPVIKDISEFEKAKLEFFDYGKNFIVRSFSFDIRKIPHKRNDSLSNLPKRKTYAVWLRIGKRFRHFIW